MITRRRRGAKNASYVLRAPTHPGRYPVDRSPRPPGNGIPLARKIRGIARSAAIHLGSGYGTDNVAFWFGERAARDQIAEDGPFGTFHIDLHQIHPLQGC